MPLPRALCLIPHFFRQSEFRGGSTDVPNIAMRRAIVERTIEHVQRLTSILQVDVRVLAAARASFVRFEIMPASSSATATICCSKIQILELARDAEQLFEKQQPREKRRLLNFVVSNYSWKGGELTAVLRQPFDLLAELPPSRLRPRAKHRTIGSAWRTHTACLRAITP
jgi:hypothetical protein